MVRNLFVLLNYLRQMHVKLPKKDPFKKQQKEPVIWSVIKLESKLQNFWKIHNKILQRQLQMSMIKKYLKKVMYLQKKDEKLLMN